MRKLFIFFVVLYTAYACGTSPSQVKPAEEPQTVMSVDLLMASASELVDQEIVVSGLITHVCKHGGQRCFVMGSTDDVIIRVEAGDQIGSFRQEYVGDELQITGILRLVPVDGGHVCSEEEEEDHEHDHGTELASDTSAETEPLTNEEYVPRYFIDGLSFIVLNDVSEDLK